MDDLPVDRPSPVASDMPSNNPVIKNDGPDELTPKDAASSEAAVDSKIRANKNVSESSKSGKKTSSAPTKRALDKSSKTTATGAKKAKATRGKSPTKKKAATNKKKSPIKKKTAASKEKKPQKSSKENGKKAKPVKRSTSKR